MTSRPTHEPVVAHPATAAAAGSHLRVVVEPSAPDATPSACADARRWVDAEAVRLGITNRDLRDDAALVVSELVSNALLHGAAPVVVSLTYTVPDLVLSVDDAGGPPYLFGSLPQDPTATHGRGLGIVAVLGTAWGITARRPGPGKAVWCRLHDAGSG